MRRFLEKLSLSNPHAPYEIQIWWLNVHVSQEFCNFKEDIKEKLTKYIQLL